MKRLLFTLLLAFLFLAITPVQAQELGCYQGVCYCQRDDGIIAYTQGDASPCAPPPPLNCPGDCDCPGARGNNPNCPAFDAKKLDFSPIRKPVTKQLAGGQGGCNDYCYCYRGTDFVAYQFCVWGIGSICPGPYQNCAVARKPVDIVALNFTPIKPAKEGPFPTGGPPNCDCKSGWEYLACQIGLIDDCELKP